MKKLSHCNKMNRCELDDGVVIKTSALHVDIMGYISA